MKKKKIIKANLITIFLSLIVNIIIITVLNKKAMPVIVNYANVELKRVGIEVLRNTGIKEVNKEIKDKELFKLIKNNQGEIENIDFDTTILNDSLVIISNAVRERLNEVMKGENLPDEVYANLSNKKIKNGIIYEVPLGFAFNNAFFNNLGPKIPVKITYSGNVGLDVKTKVSEYGINSALIEIYIYVEVTQTGMTPFLTKDVKLVSEIPIVIKVIRGSIPNYLIGNSTYSLK